MSLPAGPKKRRTFRWPKEARDLVRSNLDARGRRQTDLVTSIAQLSGNPRNACLRFVRSMGISAKRVYRPWTEQERQRLLQLVELHPVREIARLMRRSESSIFRMLRRMGASRAMGKDGFTKYSLAALLHIRHEEVQTWIDKGWLTARVEGTAKLPRVVIAADEFACFCKKYQRVVVGNRLNRDRLEFVRNFVFPPSHAELLPVRAAKKERAAYDAQLSGNPQEEGLDSGSDGFEEEGGGLRQSA
jgi:Homeodomain-like domain